ncbi:hypothetical protein KIW84_025541 [Lathyrus oleraceus]|uniref:Replication protein A 70 kDa DNA-binding subunit B/D first OB fold domain-containing protein n=1 Tax=Pisum sativum TaxID=3888 RepID=A0A9D4YN22_PEA|nr:hypothetical protein KIW84_025541 [Pisum sativum]
MSRKVDSVKDINDSKETWRLAVRIMDVWSVVNNKGIAHLEMIVMDSLGDRIQVLIRHDHLLKWKEVIKENMTCIINNGSVYNNDFQWKVCDHSKKFVFLGGTTMKAVELQNIPPKGYFFKDFGEILQGKCKTDRLEDIIGAVSEINHIQSNTPGKKVVVFVVLKDLKLPTNEQKEKPTQSAKARIYRKSVIDDKKSKRLKIALKENGTFDKRRGNDLTALRIPLSELSPNILNDGRGIANVERFDNTFAATTSNQDPIPELQLNELFASDSGDDNMNDESDGYSSATNSSFDEDEMSNGTDAMETFEITSGKVQLPLLKPAPKVLQHLLFDNESCESKKFQQQIRMYNVMFAFTSPGAKVDNRFNNGRCPPNFRIQGQSCHRIGSMLPMPGQNPRFAQLYVYDTENEIENRMHGFSSKSGVDVNIVRKISEMLYEHNVHAQSFRMARDRLCEEGVSDLKLRLISERRNDGRIYNQPTVAEVAALIVGDVDTAEKRDIIVQKQCGELQRIDEYHTSYLGYQYPLLFPYGEDGYRPNVRHRDKGTNIRHFTDITQSEQNNKDISWEEATKRNRLTIRE